MSHPEALEELIEFFRQFPGVGRKTATRYAYWLAGQPQEFVHQFGSHVKTLHEKVKVCQICGNRTQEDICAICQDQTRFTGKICVVEQAEDILRIEASQYHGKYHVLGGVVDPLQKITLQDLFIYSLAERIDREEVSEIILALSSTVQGDATTVALQRYFSDTDIQITRLGRGLSMGSTIEYVDSQTLNEAFDSRK